MLTALVNWQHLRGKRSFDLGSWTCWFMARHLLRREDRLLLELVNWSTWVSYRFEFLIPMSVTSDSFWFLSQLPHRDLIPLHRNSSIPFYCPLSSWTENSPEFACFGPVYAEACVFSTLRHLFGSLVFSAAHFHKVQAFSCLENSSTYSMLGRSISVSTALRAAHCTFVSLGNQNENIFFFFLRFCE